MLMSGAWPTSRAAGGQPAKLPQLAQGQSGQEPSHQLPEVNSQIMQIKFSGTRTPGVVPPLPVLSYQAHLSLFLSLLHLPCTQVGGSSHTEDEAVGASCQALVPCCREEPVSGPFLPRYPPRTLAG